MNIISFRLLPTIIVRFILFGRTHFGNNVTVLVIIKLTKFPVPVRLCCGSGKLIFVIILSCFAIFKNVKHSLKPGETPSCGCGSDAVIF